MQYEDLLEYFIASNEVECWPWTGTQSIYYEGKYTTPARVVWSLYGVTTIPPGYCLVRRCENKSCVNPHHMILMTKEDQFVYSLKK